MGSRRRGRPTQPPTVAPSRVRRTCPYLLSLLQAGREGPFGSGCVCTHLATDSVRAQAVRVRQFGTVGTHHQILASGRAMHAVREFTLLSRGYWPPRGLMRPVTQLTRLNSRIPG